MSGLLIHGVYSSDTLKTLQEKKIQEISFDLRGRSFNLVTFKDLLQLLKMMTTEKVFLTFENDRKETILSFLNLLKDQPFNFNLIFRDNLSGSFYQEMGRPYYWMFSPDSNWKDILEQDNAKGVLLPLQYQIHYAKMAEFWDLVDTNNLEVYLHAESFEQALFVNLDKDTRLSVDLTKEVENGFRQVDQDRIKNMRIWRSLNENSLGQR